MAVLWFVEPCSLAEVYRRLRGDCCLHHQGDELATREESVWDMGTGQTWSKAASTSEMSLNFHQTTQHNHPEDSHIHTHRHENLKSQASASKQDVAMKSNDYQKTICDLQFWKRYDLI
jgi:hypothetical protein